MRALGIILAGGNNHKMRELTSRRAVAAMPIAGSYRAIDFTLSNMSNSHIQKVAVLTQYNARSLNEHLNSSKWWDFGRKQGGLYVFTPTITADNGYWYRGTADAIYQNLDFLKRSHEPYVIITSGDAVYKMDYNKVLEYHIAKKADITVVCKELDDSEDASRFGTIKMDDSMRIEEFEEKPMVAHSHTISTGIYVVRRRLLIDLIEHCAEEDRYDFVTDILIRYKNLKKIYGYKTKKLLEQHIDGGCVLSDKHGFPQTRSQGIFLQTAPGDLFQSQRSASRKIQSGICCKEQPGGERKHYQWNRGKFDSFQENVCRK